MSQPEINLNSLFDEAYTLYESFDKRDDPSNSSEFQVSDCEESVWIVIVNI